MATTQPWVEPHRVFTETDIHAFHSILLVAAGVYRWPKCPPAGWPGHTLLPPGAISRDAGYRERAKILASISGIGWLTAIIMAIEIPELGKSGNKQIAFLAGLAPMDQQSGTQDRMRTIQGGRPWIRRTLYMPALVAARFNPDMKRPHDTLIGRGKRQKVALTAIMRKLMTMANALTWRGEPRSSRSSWPTRIPLSPL